MPNSMEMPLPLDFVASSLAIRLGAQTEPRAPGWHMTSLIRASEELAKANDINPWDYWEAGQEEEEEGAFEAKFDENVRGMMAMGKLWEEAVRPAFRQWCGQRFGLFTQGPSQREMEGIHANCDGLVTAPGTGDVVAVMECKFRFTHETNPLKQDHWMRQVKGYCRMWGTDSVWFVVGNVRQRPPSAGSRVYMLTFSRQEIEENWALLTNTKNWLERKMEDAAAVTLEPVEEVDTPSQENSFSADDAGLPAEPQIDGEERPEWMQGGTQSDMEASSPPSTWFLMG